MKIYKHSTLLFCLHIITIIVLCTYCTKDIEVEEKDTALDSIHIELIHTLTKTEIKNMASTYSLLLFQNNLEIDLNKINYDVEVYKIEYYTSYYDNTKVKVSGLFSIPKDIGFSLPMVVSLHGTVTTKNQDVPSLYNSQEQSIFSNLEPILCIMSSSVGSISIAPDYIGYATSAEYDHPYMHEQTIASTTLDMVIATAKKIHYDFGIQFNNSIYTTGYSEGGFASLAFHKYVEQNNVQYNDAPLSILLDISGGTPSRLTELADSILVKDESISESFFLSTYMWILSTYNDIYNIQLTPADVISSEYVSKINSLKDFNYSGVNFEEKNLPSNPQEFFNQNFRTGVLNRSLSQVSFALQDNDLSQWIPKNKIIFVHGEKDDFVYYFNSSKTYQDMLSKGADVELVTVKDGDHFITVVDYIQVVIKQLIEKI